MNDHLHCTRRGLLALAAGAALPRFALAAPPGDSIYRLPATLTDADGRDFSLESLQGQPVIASMFYASCTMVCPMIFETVQVTLRALPAEQRKALRMLMVSIDPQHDTPAVLKQTAQQHGCDGQWLLARADEATTRKVAAVLGVQYRRLANGEYNHSTTLDLLDRQGRIVARSGKLGAADPTLVAAIRKLPSA